MGIIDRFKNFSERAKPYQKKKYEEEQRAAENKRQRKEQYRAEEQRKEDEKYKDREYEAKRRAEQNRIREAEVANREKDRELKSRHFKTSIVGQLAGANKKKREYEPYRRQRRSYRRPRYDNYYQPRYQAPPRRSTIDSVDREFDKFF
jgi:hypothetical protein